MRNGTFLSLPCCKVGEYKRRGEGGKRGGDGSPASYLTMHSQQGTPPPSSPLPAPAAGEQGQLVIPPLPPLSSAPPAGAQGQGPSV